MCSASSGSRGEKLEYDDEQFHVKDTKVYEADVVVAVTNDWRKYFQRKFDDDFADRDKVDKALLVKSDQSQAERDRALEKVLAQSQLGCTLRLASKRPRVS